jgi:hypothetical protein
MPAAFSLRLMLAQQCWRAAYSVPPSVSPLKSVEPPTRLCLIVDTAMRATAIIVRAEIDTMKGGDEVRVECRISAEPPSAAGQSRLSDFRRESAAARKRLILT